MAAPSKTSTLTDPFKLTLLIFAVIAFMYLAGEFLKPLALSVLLCFALAPGVRVHGAAGPPEGCLGRRSRFSYRWGFWEG